MHITSSEPPTKTVEQYDITLNSGLFIPIQLDPAVGDTIDITPTVISVHRAEVPSLIDPSIKHPAEDVTVFISNVALIIHRTVEVSTVVPKLDEEWVKALNPKSSVN